MLDGLKIFPAWFLVEYHVPAVHCEQSGPSCWRKEAGETQRVSLGEAPIGVSFPLAHRAPFCGPLHLPFKHVVKEPGLGGPRDLGSIALRGL